MLIDGHFTSPERWQLHWPIGAAPLVYLDIETEGLFPQRGQKLLEVAVVDSGGVRLHYEAGVEEKRPFCAKQERQILQQTFDHLSTRIVVAHNAPFDLRFLEERAIRLGLDMPAIAFIDTLQLARLLLNEQQDFRLEKVALALGLEVPATLHRAATDAILACSVFEAMVETFALQTLEDVNVRRFGGCTARR